VIDRADILESKLLVLRHRQGDPSALRDLVRLWERPLLYYLWRLLDSEPDAWDALQETWYRVARNLSRLRDDSSFPAWLYAIARNAALRSRRRTRLEDRFPEQWDAEAPPTDTPGASLAGFEAIDIHRGLARLSLAHREALTLHFLEGFSVAEIGAITGAPEGTVKSRLHHARHALRASLEGDAR
jgi:RNA polymerase sigma-70 factor (ECF subfamily)